MEFNLEKVKYIALIRIKMSQTLMSRGSTTTIEHDKKNAVKFVLQDKKIVPFENGNKKEMMILAKKLANNLNLKIYDNSTNEKKWIEPEDKK